MKRIISTGVLLAAMIAAAIPSRVSAQEASAQALARARSALGPQAAQFDASIRAAREHGLPTEPLVEKALEGAAKGVPGERIMAAVRILSERLGHARGLLSAGAQPSPEEVGAVADAMQRGVPDQAIRKLDREARPGESVALSAHALADLIDRGVPVAIGLDVIAAWRSRGADPARLKEIPAAVERLVRQGVGPANAGAAVAAGVKQGRGLGSISAADVGALVNAGKAKGRGKN